MSNINKEKSNTVNQGWTIKGIEIETRIAVQKAAKKEGITLGKYCNSKLREAANNSLKIGSNISLSSEEIKEQVRIQIDVLKEELHDIVKSVVEKTNREKSNLLKRIFGQK